MTTRTFTLSLPDTLARELASLDAEVLTDLLARGLRQWRIEKALERYVAGEMSFAAAAELAGVRRDELAREAYARGLEPAFTEETVMEELS
jgi:predicted HTH domain antitoxin